jgi:hypothetical protein
MKISRFTFLAIAFGSVVVMFPLVWQQMTPKIVSGFYVDVSKSNQQNAESITQLCQNRLQHLMDDDTKVDGQFADVTYITNNSKFQSKELLQLQKNCKSAIVPIQEVGVQKGTSILSAINSLKAELQQANDNQKTVATFTFNALEPLDARSFDQEKFLKSLQTEVKQLASQGNTLIFVGADSHWQSKLKQAFSGIKNVKVCSYQDGINCQNEAYALARKK